MQKKIIIKSSYSLYIRSKILEKFNDFQKTSHHTCILYCITLKIKVLLIYRNKSNLVLFTFTVNLNLIEFLSIIICIPDVKKYEQFIESLNAPVNAYIIFVV